MDTKNQIIIELQRRLRDGSLSQSEFKERIDAAISLPGGPVRKWHDSQRLRHLRARLLQLNIEIEED